MEYQLCILNYQFERAGTPRAGSLRVRVGVPRAIEERVPVYRVRARPRGRGLLLRGLVFPRDVDVNLKSFLVGWKLAGFGGYYLRRTPVRIWRGSLDQPC